MIRLPATIRVIVAVSGSRDWVDRETVGKVLVRYEGRARTLLIHGCCSGLDLMAATMGAARGFLVLPFPAEDHGPWPACGPRRNRAMAEFCKSMLDDGYRVDAHAFPLPSSRGTPNFVEAFTRAGIAPQQHGAFARELEARHG